MCSKSSKVIEVKNISKSFLMFSNPIERLKQLVGVEKNYRKHEALQSISFDVYKGEAIGIIGVNGSGKSTLLQIICGTLTADVGYAKIYGRIAALLELGAGFNPEFTGVENVYLSASLMGLSKKETDAVIDQVISFADIGEFIYQPVKTYSSGMFARLAFSTAIHAEPDILIVDEILAVGDSRFQRKCLEKLRDIRSNGCTLLFVSHDDYQVRNICDKVLYLKSGKQYFFGDAKEGVGYYLQDLQEMDAKIINNQDDTASLSNSIVELSDPMLRDENGNDISEFFSGGQLNLSFNYKVNNLSLVDGLVFVFNLYRKDGVYICGTTTKMQDISPYPVKKKGRVTITFPKLDLLAGIYNWRVAVNDFDGVQIIKELLPVCEFSVQDSFAAVGIYGINHEWFVE